MLTPLLVLSAALPSPAALALPGPQAAAVPAVAAPVLSDAPLEPFRAELLELAFETADLYPLHPFVKDHARAVESVAGACFELDQPRRALRCIEAITNWRRGAGYAGYAFYCAERGARGEVEGYIDRALEVARTSEDAQLQEWRAERIVAQVERTRALLEGNAPAAEAGPVDAQTFARRLGELAELVAAGDFEQSRAALEGYLELYGRCFEDEGRCRRLEREMALAWKRLPVPVQVGARLRLAGLAAERGAGPRTLAQVEQVEQLFEDFRWEAEQQAPILAHLATLRWRVEDRAGARAQLEAAVVLYFEHQGEIEPAYRAGVLRPLAEAHGAMGEAGKERELYRRAVEEGAVNTNLMPRIDNLVATCNSMARQGFEPDAALWARMRAIRAEIAESLSTPG